MNKYADEIYYELNHLDAHINELKVEFRLPEFGEIWTEDMKNDLDNIESILDKLIDKAYFKR